MSSRRPFDELQGRTRLFQKVFSGANGNFARVWIKKKHLARGGLCIVGKTGTPRRPSGEIAVCFSGHVLHTVLGRGTGAAPSAGGTRASANAAGGAGGRDAGGSPPSTGSRTKTASSVPCSPRGLGPAASGPAATARRRRQREPRDIIEPWRFTEMITIESTKQRRRPLAAGERGVTPAGPLETYVD